MTEELVLYTNPMSRGRIVRWMLEEIGQPYRAEMIAYGPAMKSPEYRAINPMGKVPALVHGKALVTEVNAICAYLADAFLQAGLAPASGSPERGAYYRWLFYNAGPVEASVTNNTLGVVVPDEKRGFVGYGSFETVIDVLDELFTRNEYALGERFSAVDVTLGSQIGWGLQFGTMPRRPAFEAYGARLQSRPAAVRARELDDAAVAELKARSGG